MFGQPGRGTCRYWRKQNARDLNAGRNRNRAGRPDPRQGRGRIARLLGVRAEEPMEQPVPGSPPREAVQPQGGRVARNQPTKRKLAPNQVMEDYVGPRLTFSQEVARLFHHRPVEAPVFSQDDFPRLTRGRVTPGPGATEANPPGQPLTHVRPRSRSPHTSVWIGAKGRHLEGGKQEVIRWPWQEVGGTCLNHSPPGSWRVSARPRTGGIRSHSRHRKSPGTPRASESRRNWQLNRNPASRPKKRRELDSEGFKRIFGNRLQASQERGADHGGTITEAQHPGEGSVPKKRKVYSFGRMGGSQSFF